MTKREEYKIMFRNSGYEIWLYKHSGTYLLLNKLYRFGKFYNTYQEAVNEFTRRTSNAE